MNKRLLFVMGTRPEIIKLYPVIQELKDRGETGRFRICFTGQHDHLARELLETFHILPDCELDVMVAEQSLNRLAGRLLSRLDDVLENLEPGWVVAQGDTTSVWAAAMAAFHRRIRFAHVEAGLRTWDRKNPFPEEMNRLLTARLADLHFAPTPSARRNLLLEGVPERAIKVVGNTVVDALRLTLERLEGRRPALDLPEDPGKIVLVTLHRREIQGEILEEVCRALIQAAREMPDIRIVLPLHPNPRVRESVYAVLGNGNRASGGIHVIEPPVYEAFVSLMKRCWLIVTDSGGIQEEAPFLGKPVLIVRDVTERPECVQIGAARLIGADPAKLVAAIRQLHDNPSEYRKMTGRGNPFGDGRASARILDHLDRFSHRAERHFHPVTTPREVRETTASGAGPDPGAASGFVQNGQGISCEKPTCRRGNQP